MLVAQSCPTLCNPKRQSLTGSSVHGILQVRILQWVAIPFSRASSQPMYSNPLLILFVFLLLRYKSTLYFSYASYQIHTHTHTHTHSLQIFTAIQWAAISFCQQYPLMHKSLMYLIKYNLSFFFFITKYFYLTSGFSFTCICINNLKMISNAYAQLHASSTGPTFILYLQHNPHSVAAPEERGRSLYSHTEFALCKAAGWVLLVLNFNNQASDFLFIIKR